MNELANITGEQIRAFIIVIAALVVFGNGIFAFIKHIKDLQKPKEATLANTLEWRRNTEAKINTNIQRLNDVEAGNAVLCKGILAMLGHELTGNGHDELKKAQKAITDYLVERR